MDSLVVSVSGYYLFSVDTSERDRILRDYLARIAEHGPVDLAMSIAIFDPDLQELVEPGTPTAAARLATVRAAREAGLECGVFLMPVLPYLTDTTAHLDAALEQIADAGASYVVWTALYLKPGVREWYLAWLHRFYPQHEPAYRRIVIADGPAVLGYERYREQEERTTFGIVQEIVSSVLAGYDLEPSMVETFSRVFFGAMSASGAAVSGADDPRKAGAEVEAVIAYILAGLRQMAESGAPLPSPGLAAEDPAGS